MAARNLSPVRTLVRELIPIVGSVAFNGAGAIDNTTRKGLGFSVSRVALGQYRVSLINAAAGGGIMKFADIIYADGQIQGPASADVQCETGPIDYVNMTVDFFTVSAGVAADPAAGANSRLNFMIWVRNSSATPTKG